MSDTKEIRASFDAKNIARLVPFMARQDIRYYLCGVCIEKADQGGVYLVTTDGHSMAVVYDAAGSIEGAERVTISVSAGLIAAAKRAKQIAGVAQKVLLDGKRVRLALDFDSPASCESYVQAGDSLVEGTFPNWRKVTPDFSKLQRGALTGDDAINAVYLARCAKLVGGKGFCGLSFWQEAPRKAVVIQANSALDMFVIIMPMMGDSDELQRSRFAPFVKVGAKATEEVAAEAA